MNVIYLLFLATARMMVTEYGIKMNDGTIRICYGTMEEHDWLPIYVINPPEKYGTEEICEEKKEIGKELTVFLL